VHCLTVVAGATVAILLQQTRIDWPIHFFLHFATAITTGVSSFTMMCDCDSRPFQHNWNHVLSHSAPHSQDPEASEIITADGCCLLSEDSTEIPFQSSTNLCHHSRSDLASSLSLIKCSSSLLWWTHQ